MEVAVKRDGASYLDLSQEYAARKDDPAWLDEDRAQFERKLWTAVPLDVHRVYGYRIETWFGEQFKVAQSHIRERSDLLNAGHLAGPLWPLIHKQELIRSTAVRLLQEGRRIAAKTGIPSEDGVRQALSAYLALPGKRTVNGRTLRARTPKTLRRKDGAGQRQREASPGDTKTLWRSIRENFAAYMRPRMAQIDPVTADRLWTELEAELNTFLDSFSWKISRIANRAGRRANDESEITSRRKLNQAFKTLHMEPPRPGKAIDMKKAREQKRILARAYHPDRHAGDETTRPQYQAVIDAYNLIEEFVTTERRNS